MTQKTSLALLFGGRSSEHGISCVTAGGILAAIDRDRYDVTAIGITRDGRYLHVSDDPADWQLKDGVAPEVPSSGEEVLLPTGKVEAGQGAQLRIVRDGRLLPFKRVDVMFPLLHGPYGEDGTIQGLFDLIDMPYVGAGVFASAACQDKHFTKVLLSAAGLRVADGFMIHEDDYRADGGELAKRQAQELTLPLFVKPSRAGSSVGVSRVTDLSQLEQALETAFAEDPRVLVEAGVSGREVECGVLQETPRGGIMTTLPGEVRTGDDLDFYDYESKYFGKGTVEIEVPARLEETQIEQVRAVAEKAFRAVGLEGLARVDVFVTDDGIVVNEINTMPGFTPFSMFPVLWDQMGLSYSELLTHLIELASNRRTGLR
ncbi:D-alanine--D-alanine ligase family protein [Dermabacteraceae bacterium P13115]